MKQTGVTAKNGVELRPDATRHSPAAAELLFDVICTAYERSSVVVTTNLPFEEWKEVLGSERLTGAALVRLIRWCTIVGTGRESFRLP
jgi:DNA replication protein DnaC